ncbi:MAG: indole-3-glycerol-phosphate synthase [Steroidobacteraceae bacterium]
MGLLTDMVHSSTARVAAARARVPDAALREVALARPAPPQLSLAPGGFDVIAELKLRSPSMGDLSAATGDPLERLAGYAAGGAAVCSILTEPTRFDGELAHLERAASVLAPLGVPAMRKDFLVDPYQLLEARAAGASGVLLIVRMLERERLAAMLDTAAALELFVLLEAFDAGDLAVAREIAGARAGVDEQVLLGLNCRDLETLAIDPARFERLRDALPERWPAVAESGVQSAGDAAHVAALGYRLALVGTSLMQRADAAGAVRELVEAGRDAAGARR